MILLWAINSKDELVGVIVCKLEPHRGGPMRGYIAMLATREDQRGKGIASKLVRMACDEMIAEDADEVRPMREKPPRLIIAIPLILTKTKITTRLLSKQKTTTSPPFAFTRNWASSEANDYIDTT